MERPAVADPGRRRRAVVKLSGTSAPQRAAWREAAQAADLRLAAWLREAADAATLGSPTAAELRTEIAALRLELARGVGNNLNQLARALHAGRGPGQTQDNLHAVLAAAARDLAGLRSAAEAVLRQVERGGQRGRR